MTDTDDALTELARLRAEGTPCALVTVVRAIAPTSGKAGQKAVVTADGTIHGWIGGGCAQPAVTQSVAAALADGEPRLIRVAPPECAEKGQPGVVDFNMGCASRGTLDLFIEPMRPSPVVRIHGSAPAHATWSSSPREWVSIPRCWPHVPMAPISRRRRGMPPAMVCPPIGPRPTGPSSRRRDRATARL